MATIAVLGIAGTANALVFTTDDTLLEFGSIQFANINPLGVYTDVLFVDFVDVFGAAPPGSLATEFLAPSLNTGAFAAYNGSFPTPALIRSFSFDPVTDVSGFIPGANGNTFIELPPSSLLTEGALLAVDLSDAELIGSPGSGLPITSPGLFPVIFRATGLIKDVASGETSKIQYEFTAVVPLDPSAPSQTDVGSFSGIKIVTGVIPEPTSIVGLLASCGFVAAGAIKKRKNSDLN